MSSSAPLAALAHLPRHAEAVARQQTSLSPEAFRSGAAPTYLSPADVESFAQRGFCVVRSAFTVDEMAAATADLDRFEASNERRMQEAAAAAAAAEERSSTGNPADINVSGAITFTGRAVVTSEPCKEFSRHPVMQAIVRDIIGVRGGKPRLYNDQCVYKKPAAARIFPCKCSHAICRCL